MTISAGGNGAVGSPGHIPLRDSGGGQRFDGDDATRRGASRLVDDGLWEWDHDQEVLSNVSDHNHFVPDPPSLPTKTESEALNLSGYDQQEPTVNLLRGTQASGDHVLGDAPGPVQSNTSERECQ